jgi:FkbM family methyltransferase
MGLNIFAGSYDAIELKLIAGLLSQDSVVFDIGANIGYYAIFLERHSGCRVVAFEPSPREYQRLEKNIALNHCRRVEAVCLALGDIPRRSNLYLSNANTGVNSLILTDKATEAIQVQVETLDRFVAEKGIGRIDFLKIDVEGSEHSVLQGGYNTIQKYKPGIFYESWPAYGKRFADARLLCPTTRFLAELGYGFFIIEEGKPLHKLEDASVVTSSNILSFFSPP